MERERAHPSYRRGSLVAERGMGYSGLVTSACVGGVACVAGLGRHGGGTSLTDAVACCRTRG